VTSAPDLLRGVGLLADGPSTLTAGARAAGPGVYVVELPAPRSAAPIDLGLVGQWLVRVPTLQLDGASPTSKQLEARLAAFWIPSATVLFIGSAKGSIGGRVAALRGHVLGDPRPHAAAQWLKTLGVGGLRVWWATTDAPEEYEDALLEAFAASVGPEERRALPDQSLVLPFANLRSVTGETKKHGITRSVLPIDREAAPPATRTVQLPQGDAEGSRPEPRGSGTTRRTNVSPPRPARSRSTRRPSTSSSSRPTPEPPVLSAEGAARLEAELQQLTTVRRSEVIDRVRTARQLGDLRENAEYAAAREEQSFLEGRIQQIEAALRTAIVAEAAGRDRVAIGSRVSVNVDGETRELTIVGARESDPSNGRISYASPVGAALVGHAVGEEAVVRTPGGEVRYRIVAIH
jgi:transcription elongation factor GreA